MAPRSAQPVSPAAAAAPPEAGIVGVERASEPATSPHDVADQLGLLRSHRAEPDRLGVAVEHAGDVDQVDRLVVDDALPLLHQLLDEAAQTGIFGVGRGHDAAFKQPAGETIPKGATRARASRGVVAGLAPGLGSNRRWACPIGIFR